MKINFKFNSKSYNSANLPYIKAWDKINMDKEVYTFEPELALYWWEKTGFELYEKLIFQAKTLNVKL